MIIQRVIVEETTNRRVSVYPGLQAGDLVDWKNFRSRVCVSHCDQHKSINLPSVYQIQLSKVPKPLRTLNVRILMPE